MTDSAFEFTRLQSQKIGQLASRLNLAAESTGIGFWELYIPSGIFWRSGNLDKLLGCKSSQMEWTFETFLNVIDLKDQEKIRESIQDALSCKQIVELEFRVTYPDGSTHWLLQKSKVYQNDEGTFGRILGSVIDQ
jgi:PAS domain-containing protein